MTWSIRAEIDSANVVDFQRKFLEQPDVVRVMEDESVNKTHVAAAINAAVLLATGMERPVVANLIGHSSPTGEGEFIRVEVVVFGLTPVVAR